MLSPKFESMARACAKIVRDGRLKEIVSYLQREEDLTMAEAVGAATLVLSAPLEAPLMAGADVSFSAVVDAVRRHVMAGGALSPPTAIAGATGVPKSLVSQALRELAQEGLVAKEQIPGAPAYCRRWVRKPVAQWEPKSQFKGPND